jgi:anthranilate phosphoribosyltransferase
VISNAIKEIVAGHDLSPEDVEAAMDEILEGEASTAQIAAFVVGLRMKGESAIEIAAAARSLRKHCETIRPQVDGPLLDTCGTGGDGLQTFNISTAAAIVAAACGVAVAKHGNRAVSSKAGSADVLEALGVRIDLAPERVLSCIEEVGIGFMFAPSHHAAMRHAAPVRRELGVRTLFNLLGPLSNPASASHQLVGVYDPGRIEQLAQALGALGLTAAWVVHGEGGLDEISPAGPSAVAQLADGEVSRFEVSPRDFGLSEVSVESLGGGDAACNAAIIRDVLDGQKGPPRIAVVLNAAAALCVTGGAGDPKTAAEQASEAIDNGDAKQVLDRWAQFTQAT